MIGDDERMSKESYNMMEKNGIVGSKIDYNGYFKFANGLTIQWGDGTIPIGYPVAFFRIKRKCEK